jgi:hypothetical protein
MFGGAGAAPAQGPRPDAENVFADVFEEVLLYLSQPRILVNLCVAAPSRGRTSRTMVVILWRRLWWWSVIRLLIQFS